MRFLRQTSVLLSTLAALLWSAALASTARGRLATSNCACEEIAACDWLNGVTWEGLVEACGKMKIIPIKK